MRTQRKEHDGQAVPLMPLPAVEQPPCIQGVVRGGGGRPVNHCGQNEKLSVVVSSSPPSTPTKLPSAERSRRAWCQQKAIFRLYSLHDGHTPFCDILD